MKTIPEIKKEFYDRFVWYAQAKGGYQDQFCNEKYLPDKIWQFIEEQIQEAKKEVEARHAIKELQRALEYHPDIFLMAIHELPSKRRALLKQLIQSLNSKQP